MTTIEQELARREAEKKQQEQTKFVETKTTELSAVIRDFLSTDIGRRFKNTPERFAFVYSQLEQAKIKISVASLVRMVEKLDRLKYDILNPTPEELARAEEQRRQQQAAEAQAAYNDPAAVAAREQKAREAADAAEKALFASWWVPLPGENSLQTWQRANGLREAYFRKKYPRATPSTAVHPDTIRNTKAEQKFVRQQQEAYRNRPKFVVHQD